MISYNRFATVLTLTLSAAVGACQQPGSVTPSERQATLTSVSTQMSAFRLSYRAFSIAEFAHRSSVFAAAMLGDILPEASFHSSLANAVPTLAGNVSAYHQDAMRIKMKYHPENSEIQVGNSDVTSDVSSLSDVGEPAARAVFVDAFNSLVTSGEIDSTGLDPGTARLSKVMQGEGQSGQAPVERIKEYRYFIPRRVNGIEVANSGVRISVHRSGKIASIATYGASVVSTAQGGAEVPGPGGYTFTPTIAQAALAARAANDSPNSTVKSLGPMYFLPEGSADAVVEPTELFFVTPTVVIEGKTIHGRAHVLSYSVRDASLAAVVWPRPAVNAKGDPGK
jgi:hypothetical protein